jgi:hypothetical protein
MSRLLSLHLSGEHAGGALVPYDTRTPEELLHHLPALVLRRRSVSAEPTETLSAFAGIALLDRRPPHYRCPAVPGFEDFRPGDPDGAWLLRSSLGDQLLTKRGHCVLLVMRTDQWPVTAPLRQPVRRPFMRLLWLRTAAELPDARVRSPTPSSRCCSLTSLLSTANCIVRILPLRQLRHCSRRPLITAGRPVQSSVPSPSCINPGFGTPPPHRPANCNCGGTAARQFVSARPCGLSELREKP